MNYAIEEYVFNDYNASSKARKDVSHFVNQFGFRTLIKNDKSKNKNSKFTKILKALHVFTKVFLLGSNDVLFLQTSHLLLKPILHIKKIRKFKVIYLIHDVFSLRFNTEMSIQEHKEDILRDIQILNECDCVIAHNQLMINRLRQLGCKTQLISLGIFDYDCNLPAKKRTWHSKEDLTITFAGNISKSPFLDQMDKNAPNFQMNIYGAPKKQFQHLNYKGCVDADLLPNAIEGHLGLIWEGDYKSKIEDNYNEINNPHKLSMYIVSGLPIIAFKGTAAGKFIEKEGIGLTIYSLDDLGQTITQISETQYQFMAENCLRLREKLTQGYFLQTALTNSLKLLS